MAIIYKQKKFNSHSEFQNHCVGSFSNASFGKSFIVGFYIRNYWLNVLLTPRGFC